MHVAGATALKLLLLALLVPGALITPLITDAPFVNSICCSVFAPGSRSDFVAYLRKSKPSCHHAVFKAETVRLFLDDFEARPNY